MQGTLHIGLAPLYALAAKAAAFPTVPSLALYFKIFTLKTHAFTDCLLAA